MEKLQQYLKKRCNVDEKSGCWIWEGGVDSWGYGQFHYKKKTVKAHRKSYEAFKGEIPTGMFVCHTCDTPSCINPDHLWLGTPKQNAQDRNSKFRFVKLEKEAHPMSILTQDNVTFIRNHRGVYTPANFANMFDVKIQTIYSVLSYHTWK